MSLTPRLDALEENLILNGAMDLWQRSTGATQTQAAPEYVAMDRFHVNRQTSIAAGGTVNITRQTDVPTFAQSGFNFRYSARIRCNTVATADPNFHHFGYRMEGNDFARIHGRKAVFSFWAKTNKAGEYTIRFINGTGSREWFTKVTLPATLTWTRYAVAVDFGAEPAASFTFDHTMALRIEFVLHLSAANLGSPAVAHTWVGSGTHTGAQVNFMDTVGNDLFITGVMMHAVSDAVYAEVLAGNLSSLPNFSRAGKNLSEEIARCQRYYEKGYDLDTPPGSNVNYAGSFVDYTYNGQFMITFPFKVTKRSTPSTVCYGTNGSIHSAFSGASAAVGVTYVSPSVQSFSVYGNYGGNAHMYATFTADAEL